MEDEIWEDISVLKDRYRVSSLGRILNLKSNKIVKGSLCTGGYLQLDVVINGERNLLAIHRLVGIAFIPNPDNLPEVNHKKGIKIDNRASQLEWSTSSDNVKHAYDTGLKTNRGTNNPSNILTEIQVLEIRTIGGNLPLRVTGEIYGISKSHVGHILSRKIWKHI